MSAAASEHLLTPSAPPPLDLRLLVPSLTVWGTAWWALAQTTKTLILLALPLSLVGVCLCLCALHFYVPRHRLDRRLGAPTDPSVAFGSGCATVAVSILASVAVLLVVGAHLHVRQLDPLTQAAFGQARVQVVGTLTAPPRVSVNSRRTTVLAELAVSKVNGVPARAMALVFADANWLDLSLGQKITAQVTAKPAAAGSKEVALLSNPKKTQRLAVAHGALGVVAKIRAALVQAVGKEPQTQNPQGWPAGSRALVPGVALGDDQALPAAVRADMRTVSLTHLTAVSGQHLALTVGIFLALLGVLPRKWRAALGAVILIGLVILVRPSGSVLRASVMGALMLIGVCLGRRTDPLPGLATAVVILILFDPWQARDYGFALSVAATAGIVLGAKSVQTRLSGWLPPRLAAAISLPLVAQFACAPLLILLQPKLGVWSVVANVLAEPVVPLITLCGLLAAFVAPWWSALAAVLAQPALAGCAWLVTVARVFAHLPGALLPWPRGLPGALSLALCQVGVVWICTCRFTRLRSRFRVHDKLRAWLFARARAHRR